MLNVAIDEKRYQKTIEEKYDTQDEKTLARVENLILKIYRRS